MIKLLGKYRKALLIFLGVETLIALLVIYGLAYGQGFDASPLISFTNVFHEIMFVFIVIPISSTIGAIIGGYALTARAQSKRRIQQRYSNVPSKDTIPVYSHSTSAPSSYS